MMMMMMQSNHDQSTHETTTAATTTFTSKSIIHRRGFVSSITSITTAALIGTTVLGNVKDANAALPLVTVAEFETILKDSAKSISLVEFAGSKSDKATVTLMDGTQFALMDLYESPTDPRSPLKLVATCRSYKVQTKFNYLESSLENVSPGSKKKVVYMNKRVQDAYEKEQAKKERIKADEEERLQELERLGLSE